jgi:hypothetical protein
MTRSDIIAPIGEPAGSKISNFLAVPDTTTWGFVRDALAAIDSVHGDGILPTIAVHRGSSDDPAAYVFDRTNGRALRIEARDITSYPRIAVIHEIGHFLDQHALGTPGRFASVSGQIPGVSEAIDKTAAIAGLRGRLGRRYAIITGPRGRRRREGVSRNFVQYLLEPEEQFARAYAQFIVVAHGGEILHRELDSLRTNPIAQGVYFQQWRDDDFMPVNQAFDVLFRRRGWIT